MFVGVICGIPLYICDTRFNTVEHWSSQSHSVFRSQSEKEEESRFSGETHGDGTQKREVRISRFTREIL